MSTITPRAFTINYPIESVKDAIEKISKATSKGFALMNKNEMFGTYEFNTTAPGWKLIILNIQLKKVLENETAIDISSPTTIHSSGDSWHVNDKFKQFTDLISKALNGEELETKQEIDTRQARIAEIKKNSKVGKILLIIFFTVIAVFFISIYIYNYRIDLAIKVQQDKMDRLEQEKKSIQEHEAIKQDSFANAQAMVKAQPSHKKTRHLSPKAQQ